MKTTFILLLLIASFQVFSQNSQLNGAWILTAIRHDNTLIALDIPDPGPYRWTSPNTHWLFKNEKSYEIDYPCCLLEASTISVKGDNLLIKAKGGSDELFGIEFRNDSLILTSELPYGAAYYLIKDTLPLKELDKFTSGYINPVCFYGNWDIPTGEVSVRSDAIIVWYPWKFPEKINIDANNLHHYWANNRLYLEVDGVKRPFKVKSVSHQTGNMILIPEKWVNEYIIKQNLEPYQISIVWLRRINP